MTTCMLIIDPQKDFCSPTGSLFVPGADKDMERLAKMIDNHGDTIDDIQLTLDSHYFLHIAHPLWWVNANGEHPDPFTSITKDDIEKGVWRPKNSAWQKWAVEYTTILEKNNRYALTIWPPHCIIGSEGAAIESTLYESVSNWEKKYFAIASRVTKGSNPFTEHYSAVKADCSRSDDVKTRLNSRLIDTLKSYDMILIAGEALSHCVANTIKDIVDEFSAEQIKKFVLLTDATSSVPGCEQMGQDFIDKFVAKGMQTATTITYF